MTERITLTKALAEIKILGKRAETAVNQPLVGLMTGQDPRFEKQSQIFVSNLQSANDLIKRLSQMRRALNVANATTIVKIGSREMTIAEAVELKQHTMKLKKSLLESMKLQKRNLDNSLEQEKKKFEELVDRRVQAASVGGNSKPDEVVAIADSIRKLATTTNGPSAIDPVDLQKQIEKLQSEIEDFELNADVALSEINARTEIEI